MARTIRGIEDVTAAEVVERTGATVRATRHREVWFDAAVDDVNDAALRTVDGVFRVVTSSGGVTHRRDALVALAAAVAASRIPAAPAGADGIDVVASFLGRRNYGRHDVEEAVGAVVAGATDSVYWPRRGDARPPETAWSWRVTIEGDEAMVGVRVDRARASRPALPPDASRRGALQPPLAAAMARLAAVGSLAPGAVVVDPCAGTGTIVDEIAALGLAASAGVRAGDLDPGAACDWVGDATALPFRDGSVAAAVTNPPWGGQVMGSGGLADGLEALWSELSRVLAPGSVAVVLAPTEQAGPPAGTGLEVVEVRPVSLRGAHPAVITACRR